MRRDYSAEDGLDVLEYLGLGNITDKEREVFEEKWERVYIGCAEDIIKATWNLYSHVLPFVCGDGDRGSALTARIRDSQFADKLEDTKLDEKLRDGIALEEIIGDERGSLIFFREYGESR